MKIMVIIIRLERQRLDKNNGKHTNNDNTLDKKIVVPLKYFLICLWLAVK